MRADEAAARDQGVTREHETARDHGVDWDAEAATFDEEPDHGLRDPQVRAAWAERLAQWLPREPSEVLDLGCGTGSLAQLAVEQGHRVLGVDLAPSMVERARAKLGVQVSGMTSDGGGAAAQFVVGDAARPPVGGRRFDVVLVRHVLWTFPDPAAVLRHWSSLLRPGGRLVLVEGVWGEGGLPVEQVTEALAPLAARVHTEDLSPDARLWGRPVHDLRYAVVARLEPPRHREVVDVHLIVRRGDRVLLARRAGTGYADGLWHLPSGHLEDGEDVRAAVLREAQEEVGLRLDPAEVRTALVMQHRGPAGAPRIGWFFESATDQAPDNREPDKCDALEWFPLSALPDGIVAYARAGIEAYRTGERFVLHWHEDGDAVAHEPGRERARVLPPTNSGRPHHIELWVPDLAAAEASWGPLLGDLGYTPYQSWESGRSWRLADTYVVLEQSKALTGDTHRRTSPGLNHLAFHVRDRAALDDLVARASVYGWSLMYADAHPYAGGAQHCAAYLEDGLGFEVELVAGGPPAGHRISPEGSPTP
ncbi:Glyoxalase/Bleomycin resistance protein/Dioxygenase superfamily protein [Streptomyces indicus]|uniref:Glyoxalase/Bleomycin resistance protein/Dioxygenase superfamily protein n=2 Tax=Streptomyces indicus TaxID=417292 RepID=A0A1G8XVE6_9ACTN|nr:Glyoxalase/Bleomycin resistance protein/Dioxygenase superfamily protein [Streptomyces indicus]